MNQTKPQEPPFPGTALVLSVLAQSHEHGDWIVAALVKLQVAGSTGHLQIVLAITASMGPGNGTVCSGLFREGRMGVEGGGVGVEGGGVVYVSISTVS